MSDNEELNRDAWVNGYLVSVAQLTAERDLFRDAGEVAERRIVELRKEQAGAHAEIDRMQESIDLYRATIARVEAEIALAREADFDGVDLSDLERALRVEL